MVGDRSGQGPAVVPTPPKLPHRGLTLCSCFSEQVSPVGWAEKFRTKHRREVVVPETSRGCLHCKEYCKHTEMHEGILDCSRELWSTAGESDRIHPRAAVDPVVKLHHVCVACFQQVPVPLGVIRRHTKHTPVQKDAKFGLIKPSRARP